MGEMPEEMPAAVLAAPATETAGVGGRKLLQVGTGQPSSKSCLQRGPCGDYGRHLLRGPPAKGPP